MAFIEAGEKYALIAWHTVADLIGPEPRQVAPDVWASSLPVVRFSEDWKTWLGSVRAGHLKDANMILVTRAPSDRPDVLDAENLALRKRIWRFYLGLLLTGRLACFDAPLLLTGAHVRGELGIREAADLDRLALWTGLGPQTVERVHLEQASRLDRAMATMEATRQFRRFFRVLSIYIKARATADVLDQVHQYCRCIEGFIIPPAGKTGRKFKGRTELFIGPGHHDLMGELYEIRSAVEHLNEHLYITGAGRESRIEMLKNAQILEWLARHCLCRVMLNETLHEHFATDESLMAFWRRPRDEQQRLWGDAVDPRAAVQDFDASGIGDHELGL